MESPINPVADSQRRALSFMLDALGLPAPPDDSALAIRVIELEHTVTALVLEAVETLAKTFSVDQDVRACSLCGRSRWVLSLRM